MSRSSRYLENFTLLIVEPNHFMRSVTKTVLQSFGARDIREADDSDSALEYLSSIDVDIMFSEWNTEPLNGVDLARVIRRSDTIRDNKVPVVMVSAYAEMEHVLAARNAGITEFVLKPFSAKTLLSRVNEVVQHPRVFVKAPNYIGPDRRRRAPLSDYENDRRAPVKRVAPEEMTQEDVNELIAPIAEKEEVS